MTDQPTCDASPEPCTGLGTQLIGPCTLRYGHDGPVHRDAIGCRWAAGPTEGQPMTDRTFDVKGRCPACGGTSLFLAEGGYVTCARLDCPCPDAASSVLERDPDNARTTADNPAASYPHRDGEFTVLGPEIFASSDGTVICWKGENYVRQGDPAASDDELREQYAAAIRAKVDGTEGCANAHRLADAVLAVRDAELQQARAERDRSDEAARRCLAQRQEMAAERYAWQERGDRAETALAMQKGISADLRVESRARGEKLIAAEAARDRVRTLGDIWFHEGTDAATREAGRLVLEALATPADSTPPDPLADLHAWLSAEAAHHRAAAPRCRIPEGFQAQDGMGAGLEIAARVVAGLIAGRGLPVSGRPAVAEAPASGHGETPGDGGDGR